MSLRELSREHTGFVSDPSYERIRAIAGKQDWTEQRKAYQRTVNTEVALQPQAQHVVAQTEQLVDAAEAIARHISIAKSLQSMYASVQKKLAPALARLEQTDIESLKPKEMISIIKDFTTVLATATDIERKAMGLSDPVSKTEQTVHVDFNPAEMSDAELDRIIANS